MVRDTALYWRMYRDTLPLCICTVVCVGGGFIEGFHVGSTLTEICHVCSEMMPSEMSCMMQNVSALAIGRSFLPLW